MIFSANGVQCRVETRGHCDGPLTAGLQRVDTVTWGFVLAAAAPVRLRASRSASCRASGVSVFLIGVAGFQSRYRRDIELNSALGATAQIIAFAAVGTHSLTLLHYYAAASAGHVPLWDGL